MHPRPEPPVGAGARTPRSLRPTPRRSVLLALCAACGLLCANASAEDSSPARQLALAIFPQSPPSPDADGILLAADALLRRAGSPEQARLPARTRLHHYSERRVRSQGRLYRLALWEATPPSSADSAAQAAAVLALFPEDSLEPLDVLEVKTDLQTRFGDAATPMLGESETFSIVNLRNAPQRQFSETVLFHVHGDRLHPITSIFTQAMQGSCANAYRQILHWATEHDDGPYPRLKAQMEMRPAQSGEHAEPCAQRPSRQQQIGQWRWHPVRERYEAVGSGHFAQHTLQ